jgi:hypothetical protein
VAPSLDISLRVAGGGGVVDWFGAPPGRVGKGGSTSTAALLELDARPTAPTVVASSVTPAAAAAAAVSAGAAQSEGASPFPPRLRGWGRFGEVAAPKPDDDAAPASLRAQALPGPAAADSEA